MPIRGVAPRSYAYETSSLAVELYRRNNLAQSFERSVSARDGTRTRFLQFDRLATFPLSSRAI